MAFRQHQHAGDAAVRAEVMEMPMQDRRAGRDRRLAEDLIDMFGIDQFIGLPQIDNKMRPRELNTVARNKIVFRRLGGGVRVLGVARGSVRDHPQLEKSIHQP